jgi:hypothetical protein
MKRCKHIWEIAKSEIQLSAFEQCSKANQLPTKVDATDGMKFFHKPVIVHRHCKTCGTEEVIRV